MLNAVQDLCTIPFCTGGFARPAGLLAVSGYGANLASPFGGGVPPIANDGIPVQLVQGGLDGVAVPADADATFAAIADGPKALVTVIGANHFGVTNTVAPEGAAPDPNAPTLAQSVATETIARWTGVFLRAYVAGDAAALAYLTGTGDVLDPNAAVPLAP